MILVDGHNLLGRTPGLTFSDEEASREHLLRELAARGGREALVVVFDGNRPGAAGEERFGGLRVVYSPAGRSADDEILRRVGAAGPRSATVVTSDRELERRARALGAEVVSCELFRRRFSRGKGQPAAREKPEAGPGEVDAWLAAFEARRGQGG